MPFFFSASIAYIEFKSEAEAEKMLEEAQGAEVQGRSILVDYVGEKSQKGARVSGKLPFCQTESCFCLRPVNFMFRSSQMFSIKS